jgi:ribosomal protein S18 acetylase RimI-like enzyme
VLWWRDGGAGGAKVSWPVADIDISAELAAAGIDPDAYVAYRPATRFPVPSEVAGLSLRSARPADLDAAAELNTMVLDEHVVVSKFARQVPGVVERYTERFKAATGHPPAGESLIFVAEFDGRVVAMAECEIEHPAVHLDSTLRAGTVGYIHVFGVERDVRRRGIGTALSSYAIDQLHSRSASGVRLLVSHYNMVSRRFWGLMGFDEVWRLFQTHQIDGG